MKKILLAIAIVLLPVVASAESYTNLWKQYKEAKKKDLPETEIKVLRQIGSKAAVEKQYGQLLKAQMLTAVAQTSISPDSANVEIARLEQREAKATDKVMKAVYASVLGKLYEDKSEEKGDEASRKSREWYDTSLADMPLLASHKSLEYEPALVKGLDSKIFYDDLLHVIGLQAKAYNKLHDYYAKNGNRPAACVFAAKALAETKPQVISRAKKSKYLQQVDSLIKAYGDLREAGELAIMHYDVIANADDETAEEKVNFINFALSRWGEWSRMSILRNALADLQQPSFAINIGDKMLLPNVERPIRINGIRNIGELYINVYKVKLDGNTDIDPSDSKGFAKLKSLIVPGAVFSTTRRYIGQPAWKELSDTLSIKGLPVGVYLIEATTNVVGIQPQRELLRVSNVYVMHQALPGNKIRFAVVNATTGKPISGAHLIITNTNNQRANHKGQSSNRKVQTLTTDHNGEEEYTFEGNNRPQTVYAYTDDDKAGGEYYISSSYYYWDNGKGSDKRIQAFTDRNIYRPGQTVHVSSIAWNASQDNEENNHNPKASSLNSQTIKGLQVNFSLRDANNKEVASKTATTDSYGSASVDFTLPQNGLTGYFHITASSGDRSTAAYFRVEQYKRPTFQVTFDKYKEAYHDGDTISVRGVATTYSGVPVQGAKVAYTINRSQGLWWYRNGQRTEVENDSTLTASDGSFVIRVPMLLPAKGNYSFDINALVTDGAGETHEGTTSLPLSNRSAFLSVDLPDKIMRDSLKTVTFTCKNLSGEDIASTVKYRIDGGEWKQTNTNQPTPITIKLTSGLHKLEAICEGDTLRKEAVLFSMGDKHPATTTHDWYYLSASQFPSDGKPVYIQVGSSDEDTQIYYTFFSGNKILARGSKHISNEVVTRKLQYKDSYGDGLTLTYAWVVGGKLYRHTAQIKRPQPDTKLRLTWKTFRDKLTPGQKEQWTLSIATPDGKPARAQLLASMYDKSLDAIYSQMDWQVNNNFYLSLPQSTWNGGSNSAIGLYGFQPYTAFKERELSFTHFDSDLFEWSLPGMGDGVYLGRGVRMYKNAQVMAMAAPMGAMSVKTSAREDAVEALSDMAVSADLSTSTEEGKQNRRSPSERSEGESKVQNIRENLTETAFFYPTLNTDKEGNVNISFTLPESVTTWRFLGLAHDSLMNNNVITAEAVASKPVMVQPNMPRFLRLGDKGTISTRIFNTTDKDVNGKLRLEILDLETEKVLSSEETTFSIAGNGTATETFSVNPSDFAKRGNSGQTLFVARIVAEGRGFSDGEQQYLPVLPDMEQVTSTIPFYQKEAGVKDIDLTRLFPADGKDRKLTIEYTNNLSWLVIQALPTLAAPYQEDAASLAAAIYANIIGRQILTSSPKIAQMIKLWQQETGSETSLTSNLSKNQDLKTLLLSETPWMAEAEHETEQKQRLAQYLDESAIDFRVNDFTAKLRKLQKADGSFAWWPGMPGNAYMTVDVVETLARLYKIAGKQPALQPLLDKAFNYLKVQISDEVKELKQEEKKGVKNLQPSEMACHYLYSAALYGQKPTADMAYLVGLLDKLPTQLTIYGKACSAVILAQYGKTAHARALLESIRQYTVYKDEAGRYFDTPKARYSWMDYRIPTQTAAIEALLLLEPDDTVTIQQMQRWLLHEKRTTSWSTSINAVNAVYSFLSNASQKKSGVAANNGEIGFATSFDTNGEGAVIRLDGKALELPKATAGIGYVKVATGVTSPRKLTVEKTSNGTSWGAVYAQYLQKASSVASAASGLSVKRQIVEEGNKKAQASGLKPQAVGDKVKVVITITADRDYDFVQVVDKRAACLEPVSQLSGYRWSRGGGYYVAPHDNETNYYLDKLSKGTHVIETEYYVDRAGDYSSGTCTVQCAYSPEFGGREGGQTITVK